MIIERDSIRCYVGLHDAQITFVTRDKQLVDKLIADNKKTAIIADFKPVKQKRSNDANSYMWILCDKIADAINSTKEEVYREAIAQVGIFRDVAIREEAVNDLVDLWSNRGIGWFADIFDSKLDGCKRVRLYSGSHTYNTKEMSRLIDYIVQQAKELDIETLTPAELSQMKGYNNDIQSRENRQLHSYE